MSAAGTYGSRCWRRPCIWQRAAPRSSSSSSSLAEAQSRAGLEDPPFLDYTRHIVLPADGKTGAGLDVYVHSGTTTRATLLWGKEDANAFLMEVLTPWGRHHVLATMPPNQYWL